LEKTDLAFTFSVIELAAVNVAEESSVLTVNCLIVSINTHCSSLEIFNQIYKSFNTRKQR